MSVVNAFSDLLRGSPFTTPIGSLVEESTEDFVGPELCQLFSQVCDAINRSTNGPKDAIRAIRRRFTSSYSSNETIAMHTLLLLENCMINCDYRFHVVVANRDVLRDLTKCLTPNMDTNAICQKVLSLIQSWAMQFSSQVDLQEFVNTFQELRARGVKFPPPVQNKQNSSGSANVSASPLNAAHVSTNAGGAISTNGVPADNVEEISKQLNSKPTSNNVTPTILSPSDRDRKLQADLAQVRINVCVLSDMLTELESDPHPGEEFKCLMSDLAQSLFEMSKRLIQAISCWEAYQESLPNRGPTDAVLLDLLNVNDELHTVLMRYGRVIRPEQNHDPSPVVASDGDAVLLDKQDPIQDTVRDSAIPSEQDQGVSNPAFANIPWEAQPAFDSFVNDDATEVSQIPMSTTASRSTNNSGTTSAVPLLAPGTTEADDSGSKDVKLIEF